MENEIEPCKFPRLGNVINNSMNNKNIGSGRRKNVVGGSDFESSWQQHQQQNSSRIVRVSRASGGKDRHSKVMTSKGLRDRRVRLSVTTAIQFYDIQDRLGYDQPSKAVDWLIKAASDSISELPSLNTTFAQTDPKQQSYENQSEKQKQNHDNNNNNFCLSKSGCSSTSETSKENECSIIVQEQKHHQNMSQTASFTELLTGGIGSSTVTSNNGPIHDRIHHGGFSEQIQLGHSSHSHSHSHSLQVSPFSGENENNSDITQLQHFPFMSSSSDQQNGNHDNYNLNFTISSSGLVGYNRGTLQSNSLLPHFQRFSPVMDHGSSTSSSSNNLPFFMGGSAAPAATPTMDQQHLQFSPLFDARLQLFYGDGSRHSDQKEKCNKN